MVSKSVMCVYVAGGMGGGCFTNLFITVCRLVLPLLGCCGCFWLVVVFLFLFFTKLYRSSTLFSTRTVSKINNRINHWGWRKNAKYPASHSVQLTVTVSKIKDEITEPLVM